MVSFYHIQAPRLMKNDKKKLNLKILITLEVAVAMAYNVYLASGPSEFESYFI